TLVGNDPRNGEHLNSWWKTVELPEDQPLLAAKLVGRGVLAQPPGQVRRDRQDRPLDPRAAATAGPAPTEWRPPTTPTPQLGNRPGRPGNCPGSKSPAPADPSYPGTMPSPPASRCRCAGPGASARPRSARATCGPACRRTRRSSSPPAAPAPRLGRSR